MFTFFEKLLNPFPDTPPQQPPSTFIAFCRYFTKGSLPYLGVMAILTACVALLEVVLFRFLGNLVDWLSAYSPTELFDQVGNQLWWMALVVLIGLPLTIFFHASIIHQTLLGNFPMRIR